MNAMELIPLVGRLLGHSDQAWNAANVVCRDLVPDGSSRRFFQLHGPERQQYVAVLPPENDKPGQDEALSFFLIGQHLQHKQAPVARIEAMDPETHLVLCEDLGNLAVNRLGQLGHHQVLQVRAHSREVALGRLAQKVAFPLACFAHGRAARE